MSREIAFAATGDAFITRRLPVQDEAFERLSTILKQANVRFTNLEVTLHHHEGTPAAVSGGTWAMGPPDALCDLKAYGFNLIAWANNHTLDYSYGGLEATEKYLNKHGFVHAGAGMNLASACEPRYLETAAGRVAIISATSTCHESAIAGDQRPDMIGRPGVNPLGYETIHKISPDKIQQLKSIASIIKINAAQEQSIKEGFKLPRNDDLYSFGNYLFKEDDQEGVTSRPHAGDLKRIIASIREAQLQAEHIIVSIHAHEMNGEHKNKPAEFLEIFARSCIDEGAHAVIGHGPHILRGIEIYKNRPIFYSLGNFIFQNDTVTHLPADFYEKYGLGHTEHVGGALEKRSQNNTIGFGVNPKIWQSVLPVWKMRDGELTELVLHPVELGYGKPRYERGWPELSANGQILAELAELSAPYGTSIEIEGGAGRIGIGGTVTM
ncbi:CapA family protein [Paenibacillus jiagnxiensis]|uniref:CapA family protein n=1 Tax=Paenibacillus jiagnxiensis TaxID=3228926 RepID=UPI00339FDBE4